MLEKHCIAVTRGGISQYQLMESIGHWSYGEVVEFDGIELVAWKNEWMDMIWVKCDTFYDFHTELDAFWSKMMELYPNGPDSSILVQ